MAWHDLCFVDNCLESAWQTGTFSDFHIATFFTTYKNVADNLVEQQCSRKCSRNYFYYILLHSTTFYYILPHSTTFYQTFYHIY
jgi:hypothetical protein